MNVKQGCLLVVLLAQITKGDLVFRAPNGKELRHTKISYQLFDQVGWGPGQTTGVLPAAVWDKKDEELLCEITDKSFRSPLEEIMAIDTAKFRTRHKNEIVLYMDPVAAVNCKTLQRTLLVVWTLPILVRFWDAHFLFITPEARSFLNMYYSRSIVQNQFDREYYTQWAQKAYLITEESDEILEFLEIAQNGTQLLFNSTAEIEVIDDNPIIVLFDSFLFRFFFQGVFVIGFLLAGVQNIHIFRQRFTAKKLKTDHRVYKVLAINIAVPFASALVLAIDGYTSRGNLSANWQHVFRTMFFGLNSAADFLIGAYWLHVVETSSISSLKEKKRGIQWAKKALSIIPWFLASLDVLTFIGFLATKIPWETLYIILPTTCFLFQLFVVLFMLTSTKRILHLINSNTSSTAGVAAKKSDLVQRAIMRRLAFWMRIISACSGLFLFCFLLIIIQPLYLRSTFGFTLINASVVIGRLGGVFAKGQFCAPPPNVKVSPGTSTSVASRATKLRSTN